MKPLFIFLCLLLALNSKATNDTLTRLLVYNFSVGDTLDYKIEDKGESNGFTYDDISYQRIVIAQAQYFSPNDSLFILEDIYSTPDPYTANDTFSFSGNGRLRFDSTSKYVVFDALDNCGNRARSLNTTIGYNQKIINTAIIIGGLGCYYDTTNYTAGLGITNIYQSTGDGDGEWGEHSSNLIYYSKNGQTWGTPATIAVGIPNITQPNPTINLFPTINNGSFKITIANANNASYQLAIYDLTGPQVKTTSLTNGTNNIQLQNPATGMYLWNVISEGATLKSGKLIIQ